MVKFLAFERCDTVDIAYVGMRIIFLALYLLPVSKLLVLISDSLLWGAELSFPLAFKQLPMEVLSYITNLKL